MLFLVYTLVLLFILYLIGRYVPPLGNAIAFVCALVGKPFVMFENGAKKGKDWCHSVYNSGVASIKKAIVGDTSVGLVLFTRIGYFLLAAMFLLGETFNTLIALPALLHTAYTNWPDWFVVTSAALFLTVPITFGAVFLEMVGAIPQNERLFPPLNKILQIGLAIYSLFFLGLSIVVIFSFFRFRAVYLDPTIRASISPLDIANMSLFILGFLGLLVATAAPILFRALILGGESLGILLIGVFSLLFGLLSFACSLIARFLEMMSVHLSRGEMSPYDESPNSLALTRGRNRSSRDPLEDAIVPLSGDLEDIMAKQFSSVVFGGSFGSQAYEPFRRRITASRAGDLVKTTALLDLAGDPGRQVLFNNDISPTAAERNAIHSLGGNREGAYKVLFARIAEKQVEAHLPYMGTHACFVYVLDCRIIQYAVEMLQKVHAQLPFHSLVVFTSVSARDLQDRQVVENLALLKRLYEAGVVTTTIVIDPTSPFAAAGQHGKDIQLEFAAHGIVGLLTAYRYSKYGWTNKTSVNVLAELPEESPFVSVSFASDPVVPGKTARRWGWFQWPSRRAKAADFGNALTQATTLTAKVVSPATPDARAFSEYVDLSKNAILLCHVPFPLSPTFAAFSQQYHRLFEKDFYHFSVVTVPGHGTTYIENLPSRFIIQVTCIYPLDPETFEKQQRVIDAKSAFRLPSLPFINETEQHKETDASKNGVYGDVGNIPTIREEKTDEGR